MIHKIARFEVRAEHVDAALAAIREFVDEVARKEGGTASYRSYQERDAPGRFTHVMAFRTPSAEEYHRKTAWAKRFAEKLGPLCSRQPEVVEVAVVEK